MSPGPNRVSADQIDPRFYDHLGEVPAEWLDDFLYQSVELVDRYGREWAIETAHRLAFPAALEAGSATAPELISRLGLVPSFERAATWVLDQLTGAGLVTAVGAPRARRYGANGEIRTAELDAIKAAALEHDPANAPFLELLDLAGAAYPEVAHGRKNGEAALLGMGQTSLWLRYFDNANPVYALNNRLAGLAAANRLPAGARVLEVGAGGGSATCALLELLPEDRRGALACYRLTEPAAFFRRRAVRALGERWPGLPLENGELDVDRPWDEQGAPAGAWDLVYGVNVFHVARRLPFALAEAHRALAPGGWLVFGEALRPFPGQAMTAEMPFQILDGFLAVETDPETRPHPGFLEPELWVEHLARAGFEEVTVVPDVRELRRFYPRFFAGALCGRKRA